MGQRKNEELLKKISLRIKELRDERGLSQEKVYLDTGIHISRVEAVQRNVSVTTIEDICSYFNISLAEFFKDFK